MGPLVLAGLFLVHLTQGQARLDAWTVLTRLVDPGTGLDSAIVRHVRLPRATAGVLVGAVLGISGGLLQTVTRNPLASPATLGVNAGAFLAVVATAVFLPGLAGLSPLSVAFLGGLTAAALTYTVAGGPDATPVRLTLAGMVVAMALAAAAAGLQVLFEEETAGLFFWGSGSLIQDGWDGIAYAWPRALPGVALALILSRALDVHELGDETARALGQRVDLVRAGAGLTGVLLAAVGVSIAGPIGFVGLVAPHLVRLMGQRRHLAVLLGAAVWGAVLLVGADVIARVASGDLSELPAGVVTAILGTPVLVFLARRAHQPGATRSPGRSTARPSQARYRFPAPATTLVAGAGLVLAVLAGMALGSTTIAPGEVLDVLTGAGESAHRFILLELRLPRVLVATVAGGLLGASGLMLQGVVRNPLAAPEVVGVMGGAGVGALVLLLAVPGIGVAWLPVAAFAGALGAFALVYTAAWRDGVQPERLALVGIGVAALATAVINLLVVRTDMRIAQALVWLSGSVYARGIEELVPLAAGAAVLLPMAWLTIRELDLHALGDDAARGLGLALTRSRAVNLLLGVALAALAVAVVGTVGFVGLVAPHAARLLVGGRHRQLLPVAVLLGAVLLVVADLVGRTVLAPAQLPAGLVTALVGAPYFVWLLQRTGR